MKLPDGPPASIDSPALTPEVSARSDNSKGRDEAFARSYQELRQLAKFLVRRQNARQLSATSLVNEVWLKLAKSQDLSDLSPLHLKHLAARAMRQVMVDLSRRKKAQRRGAGQVLITFDESLYMHAAVHLGPELLALDAALQDLALFAPRQASLIEARFFGGFTWGELATIFKLSEATVMRDWRSARPWLAREIRKSRAADDAEEASRQKPKE